MRKFTLLTAVNVLLWSNVLQAQDSLKVLNEVVISATRTEQEIIDVARSVTVIDEQEIRETSYSSVGELLSNKAALFVVGATQTPGTNQDVFLRGASSNHIAILIDGVRVTDSSSPNSAFNLAEMSLANVERVEIVYGAHSTLYGTAAMGGTINIITKSGEEGLTGYGSLQGGIFDEGNLLETSGYINYGFDNGIYISGSAFHQNVKGLDATTDTISAGQFKTNDQDGFYKTDYSLKTGFKNSAWDSFVEYKRAGQRSQIDDGAFDDDDNYYVDLTRDFLNYRTSYNLNDFSFTVNGGYSFSERIAENDSSIIDEDDNYDRVYFSSAYQGQVMTNEFLLSYKADKATFILGIGDYREAMDFNTYYFSNSIFGVYESRVNYDSLDIAASIQHVFLSGNVAPLEKLNISYGIRYNRHSDFGNHFTWEVNPSFRVGRSATAYFSYAKGFNAPSLYQLYDPTPGTVITRGNSDLKPEKGISLELGWKQIVSSEIAFTASLFHNTVQDAIEYVYIWNGETPRDELTFNDYYGDTYINANKQHIRGAEITAEISLLSSLKLNLNTTYLRAKVTPSPDEMKKVGENHVQLYSNGQFIDEEESNDKIVRRPSFMANAGLNFRPSENLAFNLNYHYTGDRYDAVYDPSLGPYGALGTMELGAYHLVNVSGNYKITNNFDLLISLKNVLNNQYSEINGFNAMGRQAFVKLVYEF